VWRACFGTLQFFETALEIAYLPVRACQQFTSEPISWIAIERLVGPYDHVIVPTLIPEREGDPLVGERRRRVALEPLQLQLKSTIQVAERFYQVAVVEVRFSVIRVDGQGALEASFGGDPLPVAEEHHLSQRHL